MKSLGQPALLDLLVQPHSSEDMEIEDLRPSKKKVIYSEVLMAKFTCMRLMVVSA